MRHSNLADELRRIADGHGGMLHPAVVVEEARPINSPLHSRFEWDDTKAAEQHRLWQARQLITTLVEQIGPEGKQVTAQTFVSLTTDRDKGGYRLITSIMADQRWRQQLLEDALAELSIFEKKYAELRELARIFRLAKVISARARRGKPKVAKAKNRAIRSN